MSLFLQQIYQVASVKASVDGLQLQKKALVYSCQ